MWEYTGLVREHYMNPRNVGEIESPDGFGETGNIKCGDALRLTFKLDENGKVADIKFKTFGCGSAIASSSMLTELCKGKTVEEMEQITDDDIADALGGLPDAKMHCSVMGHDALKLAIDYYRNGGKTVEKEVTSRVVCTCFNVTEDDITQAVRQHGLVSVEQVTNYTKAGGGCKNCLKDIKEIIEQVHAQMDEEHDHDHDHSSTEAVQDRELTTLEKIDLIRSVLNEEIRPALQRDGGDCEFVDIVGDTVKLRFMGACSGCAHSSVTSNEFIGKTLKEKVSKSLIIEMI